MNTHFFSSKNLQLLRFPTTMPRQVQPCILVLFLTLILLQSSPISSKDTGKISVGQSLMANSSNSSLNSPSGDFAFGFHQLPNNTTLFLLSIWYAKIPDTIVWWGNEGNPVSQGSKLTITANEGLILTDPQGTQLWNTTNDLNNVAGEGGVSYGYMNDTGNFALMSSSNAAAVVWETFDHPTDTLLPSQVFTAGPGQEVDSRVSESNFTKGRFQLRLVGGNLVLNTRDLVTDFAYGAYYIAGIGDGEELVYDESGEMYIPASNGSRFDLIQPANLKSTKDYYQRLTLNFDGLLTWYYYPRGSSSGDNGVGWFEIQSVPDNICMATPSGDKDSGICGYNSICSSENDKKPICKCPPYYSLMDPADMNGSCEPDFDPDVCEKGNDVERGEYWLLQVEDTDWPTADYARLMPVTEKECKASCLNDCFCAAAIFDGSNSCWKKKLPLSLGRQGSGVDRTAWLKVGDRNATNHPFSLSVPPRKDDYNWNALGKGLLGSSICVNLILLSAIGVGIFYVYKRKLSGGYDERQRGSSSEYNSVHSFTYKELEYATSGFREEIGRGAFGVVYKGRIVTAGGDNNPTRVAVKRLERAFKGGDKEFTAEVNVIGLTHHRNLVRLIGYCKEGDERLLVYEYMSNGTVADILFGEFRPSWRARIHIAHGVAKGLLYLHEECSTQIIHCDIKPQNILIDDNQNARISDFGLAKLLVVSQNHTDTAVRGTKGYVAPEWFKNRPVSVKVDVYSFGVVLLEIICCRRNVCTEQLTLDATAILTDWAFVCFQSHTLNYLVNDEEEAMNDKSPYSLRSLVMVALWCIQEDPNLRPTMKTVTQMLEGVAQVPTPPCPDSFTVTI